MSNIDVLAHMGSIIIKKISSYIGAYLLDLVAP
jgi:hypothetical protein